MTDLREYVERYTEGKLQVLDMRPFEVYMKGHLPNSILAPYVPDRWGYEISNFLKQNKGETAVVYDSEDEKKKAYDELKRYGHNLQFFNYDIFSKSGELKEAFARNITPEEFEKSSDQYTVIDVREPYEWATGTIDGAEMISLNDLFTQHINLDKNRKYAVICEHGNRSLYGTIFLADKGFDVSNITEGMDGLRRRGIV